MDLNVAQRLSVSTAECSHGGLVKTRGLCRVMPDQAPPVADRLTPLGEEWEWHHQASDVLMPLALGQI